MENVTHEWPLRGFSIQQFGIFKKRILGSGKTAFFCPKNFQELNIVLYLHKMAPCKMPFTKQEHILLNLIANGMSSSEIAAHLQISLNTVNAHRQSINRKLKGTGITIDDLKNLSHKFLEAWMKQNEPQQH